MEIDFAFVRSPSVKLIRHENIVDYLFDEESNQGTLIISNRSTKNKTS